MHKVLFARSIVYISVFQASFRILKDLALSGFELINHGMGGGGGGVRLIIIIMLNKVCTHQHVALQEFC